MASKRYRWMLLLLVLPLLLLLLLGAAGVVNIKVTINGEPMAGLWRMENGKVIGPVAPVARALGARVDYRNNTLEIEQPSPWTELDMEPAWAIVWPHDSVALAPVATLRRYLAEKQFASLTSQDPVTPVLARFEIVSGYSQGWEVPPGSSALDPYILQANLYWATPAKDTPSRTNPGIITEVPGSGWSLAGPKFSTVRIDQVTYEVKPATQKKGEYQGKPYDESTGWGEVKELGSKTLATVTLNGSNFPAYDLSMMRIQEKWRWQGL